MTAKIRVFYNILNIKQRVTVKDLPTFHIFITAGSEIAIDPGFSEKLSQKLK